MSAKTFDKTLKEVCARMCGCGCRCRLLQMSKFVQSLMHSGVAQPCAYCAEPYPHWPVTSHMYVRLYKALSVRACAEPYACEPLQMDEMRKGDGGQEPQLTAASLEVWHKILFDCSMPSVNAIFDGTGPRDLARINACFYIYTSTHAYACVPGCAHVCSSGKSSK